MIFQWETFSFLFFFFFSRMKGSENSVMKIVNGAGRAVIGGLLGHNILPCDPGKFPERSGRNFLRRQQRKKNPESLISLELRLFFYLKRANLPPPPSHIIRRARECDGNLGTTPGKRRRTEIRLSGTDLRGPSPGVTDAPGLIWDSRTEVFSRP